MSGQDVEFRTLTKTKKDGTAETFVCPIKKGSGGSIKKAKSPYSGTRRDATIKDIVAGIPSPGKVSVKTKLPAKGEIDETRLLQINDVEGEKQVKLREGEMGIVSVTFPEVGFVKNFKQVIKDKLTAKGETDEGLIEFYGDLMNRSSRYRQNRLEILREVATKSGQNWIIAPGNEKRAAEALEELFNNRDEYYVKGVIAECIRKGEFLQDDAEIRKVSTNNKSSVIPVFEKYGVETRNDIESLSHDELDEMCLEIWGSRLQNMNVLASDIEKDKLRTKTVSDLKGSLKDIKDVVGDLTAKLMTGDVVKKKEVKKIADLVTASAKARSSFTDEEVENIYQSALALKKTFDDLVEERRAELTKQAGVERTRLQNMIKNQMELERSIKTRPVKVPSEVEESSSSMKTGKTPAAEEDKDHDRYEYDLEKIVLPEEGGTVEWVEGILKRASNKYIELGLARKWARLEKRRLEAEGEDEAAKKIDNLDKQLSERMTISYEATLDHFNFVDDYVNDDGSISHPFKETMDFAINELSAGRPVNFYLYGEAGGGKTTIPEMFAWNSKGAYEEFQGNKYVTQDQLKGDWGIKNGDTVWVDQTSCGKSLAKIADESDDHFVVHNIDEMNLIDERILKGVSTYWSARTINNAKGKYKGNLTNSIHFATGNQKGQLMEDEGNIRRWNPIEIGRISKPGIVKALTSKPILKLNPKLKVEKKFAEELAKFYDDLRNSISGESIVRIDGDSVIYPSLDHLKQMTTHILNGGTIQEAIDVMAPKIIGNLPERHDDRPSWHACRQTITGLAESCFTVPLNVPVDNQIASFASKSEKTAKAAETRPVNNANSIINDLKTNFGINVTAKENYHIKEGYRTDNVIVNNDPALIILSKSDKKVLGRGIKSFKHDDPLHPGHAINYSSRLGRILKNIGKGTLVFNGSFNENEASYTWVPEQEKMDKNLVSQFQIVLRDFSKKKPSIYITGLSQIDARGRKLPKPKKRLGSESLAAIASTVFSELKRTDSSKYPVLQNFFDLMASDKNYKDLSDQVLKTAETDTISLDDANKISHLYHGLENLLNNSSVLFGADAGVFVKKTT